MSNIKIIRENSGAGGGAVYGLGVIGALFYYFQQVNTFWDIIMGILKALVWPALLIYHVLAYFKI